MRIVVFRRSVMDTVSPVGAFGAVMSKVTTGADPMVTLHGTGASVVRLPAGSVSVAVTSFWPGSNTTAENVAMPPAKLDGLYVSVVLPLTTLRTTLPSSALNVTGCVTG